MKAFARVRALADHQRGLVSRAQLLAAGISRTTIQRLIGLKLLDPVIPGVYRTPGAELDHRLKLRAALLGLRGSIVSHESAAELHGMRGVTAKRPVVTVPVGRTHRYPDMKVHEPTLLAHCICLTVIRDRNNGRARLVRGPSCRD